MKKVLPAMSLSLFLLPMVPVLQAQTMVITRSGSRPSQAGPAANFTGSVRVTPLFEAKDPSRASGASVSFEPGARSAWHTHPRGQVLIVTEGVGRVQQSGGPIEEIRAGDVVWTPPGVKHWHGASPETAMTHIAIQEHLDGKVVDWLEKVSDEQYGGPLATSREQGESTMANEPTAGRTPVGTKIRLKVGEKVLSATLIDSETAQDFVSLLTLTLTMNDLFRREKFAHLPRAIAQGGIRARTYEVGTIAYWSPGPDVAIFYRHDGQEIPDPGIIVIGKVESGLEALNVPGSVRVTIDAPVPAGIRR